MLLLKKVLVKKVKVRIFKVQMYLILLTSSVIYFVIKMLSAYYVCCIN